MHERKTILITGATDGIGKQSALRLAEQGHHILLHGKNAVRGHQAVQEIQHATKNPHVEFVPADFSSLAHVRSLAAQVHEEHERLDILINNAGVFMPRRVLTPDNLEMTFAVNYLAHFLLTNLLLGKLNQSEPARILHVSSGTHRSARIEWDNLQGERSYTGYDAYARSKLANVLFAYALADRLQGALVTSNALHPGVIHTKLLQAGWGGGGAGVAQGSETIVYCAMSPELENVSGCYFDNQRQAATSAITHDPNIRDEFWRTSARLVGLEA